MKQTTAILILSATLLITTNSFAESIPEHYNLMEEPKGECLTALLGCLGKMEKEPINSALDEDTSLQMCENTYTSCVAKKNATGDWESSSYHNVKNFNSNYSLEENCIEEGGNKSDLSGSVNVSLSDCFQKILGHQNLLQFIKERASVHLCPQSAIDCDIEPIIYRVDPNKPATNYGAYNITMRLCVMKPKEGFGGKLISCASYHVSMRILTDFQLFNNWGDLTEETRSSVITYIPVRGYILAIDWTRWQAGLSPAIVFDSL